MHHDYIINTPGFGDTEGLKNDELITEQIKEFFSLKAEYRIDHLDGIGFVTQSSLVCLTHTQQYIFDSILAIFGSDVAKYIFQKLETIIQGLQNKLKHVWLKWRFFDRRDKFGKIMSPILLQTRNSHNFISIYVHSL